MYNIDIKTVDEILSKCIKEVRKEDLNKYKNGFYITSNNKICEIINEDEWFKILFGGDNVNN